MLQFKRGKGKNNADYTIADVYDMYKFMHPESTVDRDTYIEICSIFNKYCMHEIVCRGVEITLPRLGSVSIRKYKSQPKVTIGGRLLLGGVPVDWARTKEYWDQCPEAREQKKLIRTLNEHTNGYRYRFFWDKTSVGSGNLKRVRNIKSYSFIPMRKYSRMLNDVLTDENTTIDFYLDETKLKVKVPC